MDQNNDLIKHKWMCFSALFYVLLLCFLMGKLWFSHSSALVIHWQSECSFKQAVYLPSTTCVFADIGPSVSHRELQSYNLQRAEGVVGLFFFFFHFWWVFSKILPFLVNSVITLCSWDFGSMHGETKISRHIYASRCFLIFLTGKSDVF